MTVDVLCFGILKDKLGAGRQPIELVDGANVASLLRSMEKRVGDASLWRSLAVAVNLDYAGLQTVLQDGDEVALLPPVSGGSDAR